MMHSFLQQVDDHINFVHAPEHTVTGSVVRVVGLTLEARGITAPLGAHCQVESSRQGEFINAEVGGIHDELLYLMPFTEHSGVAPGARI